MTSDTDIKNHAFLSMNHFVPSCAVSIVSLRYDLRRVTLGMS